MNIENTLLVIDQLETKVTDEQFDMSRIMEHYSCGSVGCIGGWIAFFNGGPDDRTSLDIESFSGYISAELAFARYFLGLEARESHNLFFDYTLDRLSAIDELKRRVVREVNNRRRARA